MNEAGLTLIIIALSLGTFRWFYNWRAGRHYMRKMRLQNTRTSVTSLVDSWKKEDKEAIERMNLQERRGELRAEQIKESERQTKAYYDSLHSEENIGVIKIASDYTREVKAEKVGNAYRPTDTKHTYKIRLALERAAKREEAAGLGLDLDRIGQEYGLSSEEMLKAYQKAEAMVNKNGAKVS